MDLLLEAKHNNKAAFNELFKKYSNIYVSIPALQVDSSAQFF